MEYKKYSLTALFLLLLQLTCFCTAVKRPSTQNQGKWELLLNNTGVVAMHMALTHHNTVIILDQIGDGGQDGYRLRRHSNGTRCSGTRDPSCYAHSIEYDISHNKIRPLRVESNPFCSSGSFLSNGTLLQTGGNGEGSRRIRYFRPCRRGQSCDWKQSKNLLTDNRWYASNQILPENDRVIVVGGRRVFTYEFVPKLSSKDKSHNLPFLHSSKNDRNGKRNNFYPFLHLSSDGNLFIFSNRDSILFNYKRNKVVKTFPKLPGDGDRTYPSTGSSLILPLDHTDGFKKVEVMICGGAVSGAEAAATRRREHLRGLSSCGRMVITGNKHKWRMENMPGPRLLHDMLILPTGHVIIINGAERGCAGWNNAAKPSLHPYLYNPKKDLNKRFSVLKSTKIARMYHSSAILLPNGRILVAGSNPNNGYSFRNVAYPTELRLQAFVPHHMDKQFHNKRPENVTVQYNNGGENGGVKYGEEFNVVFLLKKMPRNGSNDDNAVEFTVYAPPFATHSISMNQRMLRLRCKSMVRSDSGGWISAVLEAPPSPNVAPSGYYMITVVNGGIPSLSSWVRFLPA